MLVQLLVPATVAWLPECGLRSGQGSGYHFDNHNSDIARAGFVNTTLTTGRAHAYHLERPHLDGVLHVLQGSLPEQNKSPSHGCAPGCVGCGVAPSLRSFETAVGGALGHNMTSYPLSLPAEIAVVPADVLQVTTVGKTDMQYAI